MSEEASINEPASWSELRKLTTSCIEHFTSHVDDTGLRIKAALQVILDTLDSLKPLYEEISIIAPNFDFDQHTPGNGYRSFLLLVDRCITFSIEKCRDTFGQKDSVLFRKSHYTKFVFFNCVMCFM